MSGNGTAFGLETCADIICGLKAATIFAISTLATAGNLAALITLASTPALRNCHGLLLVSLSLADLATGLVAGTSAYPSVYGRWPFGDAACLAAACAEALVKKASLLTLTLLSIERYVAVGRPLRYSRIVTKRKTLAGLAVCWLVPVPLYASLFLTGQVSNRYVSLLHSCTITYQNQLLSAGLNVGLFVLPCLFTVCVTSVGAWRAVQKQARVRAHMLARLTASGSTRRAVKFFRMVRVMTFTFYACWAPIVIVGFACVLADVRRPLGVFFALYWLQFSNSVWNVIIYFAMNDAFRRRAGELCLCPFVALRKLCCAVQRRAIQTTVV